MSSSAKKGKYFPLLYYLKAKDLGSRRFETQIHKIRDGLAVCELSAVLNQMGYTYGQAILNVPQSVQTTLMLNGLLPQQHPPEIGPTDILLLTTRPPLDDLPEDKRRIARSDSPIEQAVFASLRPYFSRCDRVNVTLSDKVDFHQKKKAMLAKNELEKYRLIHFRQKQGGCVSHFQLGRRKLTPDHSQLAVGYLFSAPNALPNGTQLVAAFGLGGTQTLRLAYLLRTSLLKELRQAVQTNQPRLSLIEFLVPNFAPFPLLMATPDQLAAQIIHTTLRP